MAWDSTRPVPWTRLMREWVIYAVFMAVVFALFFSDNILGALTGLLISGPLYLALGAVLAKFGYQRKTIKELRGQRSEPRRPPRRTRRARRARHTPRAPTERALLPPGAPPPGRRSAHARAPSAVADRRLGYGGHP
jgi:hypothetical protein